MSFTGIYPEGLESISMKGGFLRLQWMFRKTLLQASGYFCTISELTGLSHQCQISMFSFFLIPSVIHWYKHSTYFTPSLCLWIEMSYWFPVLVFAVLKIARLFASLFFSFQTSLRIQDSLNLIFCFTLSANYSVPGNWKPANHHYHWALGNRKSAHNVMG